MPASRYDIYAEQGTTFKLHLDYKYSGSGGTGIDLSSHTGEMQVRKSLKDSDIIMHLTNNGVTGGGSTGEFTSGSGISGSGGISFNVNTAGVIGYTGGILLRIDNTTMMNCPSGKHFYDLELTNATGEVMRLVEGVFEISREITR